jgi:hypothetical protein
MKLLYKFLAKTKEGRENVSAMEKNYDILLPESI